MNLYFVSPTNLLKALENTKLSDTKLCFTENLHIQMNWKKVEKTETNIYETYRSQTKMKMKFSFSSHHKIQKKRKTLLRMFQKWKLYLR